jgi:hypothetical protein
MIKEGLKTFVLLRPVKNWTSAYLVNCTEAKESEKVWSHKLVSDFTTFLFFFPLSSGVLNVWGVRMAQWVRSLDLTTHVSLSPIRRGLAPGFVNYKTWCTRLAATSDQAYQLLAHGRWFSPASFTTKTGHHNIAEILLKVALKHKKIQINFNVWQRLCGDCCVFTSLLSKKKCWDRTPNNTFSVLKMIGTYFDIGTFNIILSSLCQICRRFWKGKGKTRKYTNRQNQSTSGKLEKPKWPWLGTGISKEMVGWIRFYDTKPPAFITVQRFRLLLSQHL